MIVPLESIATILIEEPIGWPPVYAFFLEIPGQAKRYYSFVARREGIENAITECIGYVLSNLELFPSIQKLTLCFIKPSKINSKRVMRTIELGAEMGMEIVWSNEYIPQQKQDLERLVRERTGKC